MSASHRTRATHPAQSKTAPFIHIADRESALTLLDMDLSCLMESASALRQRHFGNKVELCAIINARSGRCSMDCAFCSQSGNYPTKAPEFALLTRQELRERLAELAPYPLHRVGIVTSGGALGQEDVCSIAEVIRTLPSRWQGRVCASLGRLPAVDLELLKASGLTRFHHNLESSRAFYPRVCSTQTWQQRLDTVHRARNAHLEACSGGLFGLGESWIDRVDFAFSLKEEGIDHVPMNFLHPHAGTPLASQKPLEAAEALRIIAVFRHILPTATIRVCGGRPLVLGTRQSELFAAGANALMTGNYLTTAGKALDEDCRMVRDLGLVIVA